MITNFVSQGYIEGNDNCQFSMEEFFFNRRGNIIDIDFFKTIRTRKTPFFHFFSQYLFKHGS